MNNAAKIWVGIILIFMLIIGFFVINGVLVWTEKSEQFKQAQTRIILREYKIEF